MATFVTGAMTSRLQISKLTAMTTICCVAAFALTVLLTPVVDAQDAIQFNRDIRPIFMDTCLTCHGPDSAARKADLRMDKRDAAIEQGAISPGKPDESEMIRRILSDDPEEIMPPPELHEAALSV